jgi:membrane protein
MKKNKFINIKFNMDDFKKVTKELFVRFNEHSISAYSAQMAYFFFLSLFPFLILLFALIGRLHITYTEFSTLGSKFTEIVPKEVFEIINGFLVNNLSTSGGEVFTFSILATLWTSSKGVNSLLRALNMAYEVKENRGFVKVRIVSMAFTVFLTFSIIFAIILPSLGNNFINIINYFFELSPTIETLILKGRWALILVVIFETLLFVYRYLPNRKLERNQVLPGTIISLSLWILASVGFSYFIENVNNYSVVYGSLGAVIVLMLYFYVIGNILMIGGEINSVLIDYKKGQF